LGLATSNIRSSVFGILSAMQTRYLILASLAVAIVILAATGVYFTTL
jgi:hypothetical protein